jgi:arylsulfatase A-like enzyme
MKRLSPMMFVLLGVSVGACTCTDTSPEPREPEVWNGALMSPTTGSSALVLDRLPATFTLPETNLPGDLAAGTFVLTNLTKVPDPSGLVYLAPLPFRVAKGQRRFAPPGMRVLVGDTPLHFVANGVVVSTADTGSWSFEKENLRLSFPTEVREVRIEHPEVVRAFRRMNFDTAKADGLTAEDFVRYGISLGEMQREGLLLPAPATATWAGVTLPAKARFSAHVAFAPTPITSTSDGATVIVEVVHEGTTTEAGRHTVRLGAEAFEPLSIPLDAWAGKQVDLIVRTEPGPTNHYDYVFLGSPQVHGEPSGKIRRILVVGIDTLRPDHLSINGYERRTTPELDAWAADAVRFDRAWTSAPRTRPSFRSATTGRLPLEAVCAKNIGEVFDEAGFATAGIVSNIHLNQQFDFQRGFDLWWLDGKAKVDDQTQRAKDFVTEHADRDVYMFLHVMDPHIFYRAPEPWGSRFTADLAPLPKEQSLPKAFNRWHVYKWDRAGKLSELRKQWIEASYDGELAYTSEVLGEFLAWFDALPGDNLVVLHNDHGEEFWEHGGFEHNHTLYDDTTRAMLWIKPPGGTGHKLMTSPYPATLQDIAPTLYEFAGIEAPPPTDGTSVLPALRGEVDPQQWSRAIPIAHLHYDANRWGLVWQDHKYVLTTGTGEEELYDLKADPAEQRNLAGSVDTEPYWRQLAQSHRADVGHGWRIDIDLPAGSELLLTLPAEALSAGVIDPEHITRTPVNQEWGEVPKLRPADVGEVTLSDDKRTVRVLAGPRGKGRLYVRFDQPAPTTELTATLGGVAGTGNEQGRISWQVGSVAPQPGIVIVPPVDEATRMKACATGSGTEEEIEQLRALGYIGGDDGHND